jgi:hypothetical protein
LCYNEQNEIYRNDKTQQKRRGNNTILQLNFLKLKIQKIKIKKIKINIKKKKLIK